MQPAAPRCSWPCAFSAQRTRVRQPIGREPELSCSAQVCQVYEAAKDVEARIHRAHTEDPPADADDVFAGGNGGRSVNVREQLDQQPSGIFIFAIVAHDDLMLLLHVS